MNKQYKRIAWPKWLQCRLRRTPESNEQLIDVLRDAQTNALIDAETLGMIEGVLMFSHMKVRDIMLPKNQMICITEVSTLAEIIQIVTASGHSRFPVTGSNKTEVIGILHAKDLLRYSNAPEHPFDLLDTVRQAHVVPESKRLDLLLHDFRLNRNHMAIVVDEYGAVSGFVTLEDIIEQIVGDIADEFDIDEEAYIKSHGEKCTIIKAHTPIDEFNQTLHAQFKEDAYDTIGGVVMAGFGYLPRRGESIRLDGFMFKIIHADARRIKLLECIDERTTQRVDE